MTIPDNTEYKCGTSNLHNRAVRQVSHYPHSTDEETEAQSIMQLVPDHTGRPSGQAGGPAQSPPQTLGCAEEQGSRRMPPDKEIPKAVLAEDSLDRAPDFHFWLHQVTRECHSFFLGPQTHKQISGGHQTGMISSICARAQRGNFLSPETSQMPRRKEHPSA